MLALTVQVINIDSNSGGDSANSVSVLRRGKWKLIDGCKYTGMIYIPIKK